MFRGLPSRGLLAAKYLASGRCSRNQSVLLVGYGAFDIAYVPAALHDGSFRFELCVPNRAKEIDFQFNSCEGFLLRERACKSNSHRGISNIAKNPAVQRSH